MSQFTLMVCPRVVGYVSSTSCFIAAVPRNRSNCVPGGSKPERHTLEFSKLDKEKQRSLINKKKSLKWVLTPICADAYHYWYSCHICVLYYYSI